MRTLRISTVAVAMLMTLALSGCREYDKPEFSEIDTSETGFLVPLEGDTSDQSKMPSLELLESRKVATKRVQILHRWVQLGRWEDDGSYIPTVKLIKVKRSPVNKEWTEEPKTGTSTDNQSIRVESKDSIGFSIGVSLTAMISEKDAATFLYWNASGDLGAVMETEIRGRVQKSLADECARYDLYECKAKKTEIMAEVRRDVTEYYSTRGITITSIGMVGGLHYDNPQIQAAIDTAFVAQQQKVVNQAKFDAQQKENDRVLLEADAIAEKVRRVAKGESDAKLMVATAEAEGVKKMSDALAAAQQNPLLVQFKALEVEKNRIEKWNGAYPQWLMGGSGMPGMLLQTPGPVPNK